MAEYRIVAKVDPQTAAGTQKVKQDLRGIQTEANATEQALNRSFDQARFEKSIGGLTSRIDQLDKSITGLAAGNTTLQRSNETLGQSLDRVAASSGRAAASTTEQGRATTATAGAQTSMEAALRRVLAATDAVAAQQLRANTLLADAKRLYDAGKISAEQFATAQRLAAQAGQEINQVAGAQRMGMQQLGFQLGDVATMYSLGAKPAQIFASQIGQITQAVQLMSGGTSKFATFLGGPWGIALSLAVIALTPLVAKLFEGNDALEDAVKKLRDDAKETEINRKAKEQWSRTVEGQIALQRELNAEMEKGLVSQRQQNAQNLADSERRLGTLRSGRSGIVDQINEAQGKLNELNRELRAGPPLFADESYMMGLMLAIDRAEKRVKDLRDTLSQRDRDIAATERGVRAARVPIQEARVDERVDPIARANAEYERQRDAAVAAALGNERLSLALESTLEGFRRTRDAAIETANAQKRLENQTTRTGEALFRSREQAIGIAGRELQQVRLGNGMGLDISGNRQFRVTTGHANDASHNRYDIDVNASANPGRSTGGIVEANAPDIRARFDAMARRYQARGYKVLWRGFVWPAGGDGPGPAIRGADKHYDHMHLSAPETIVGRATGASTESQVRQDEQMTERVQERAEDFVQGVVNQAASRGLPANRQSQLNAQIDEALAEFTRRFDREATTGEKATITKALTDADAREIAQRFDEAYVQPLKRMQDLQGKTGLDRQVLNAQLDESLRLGRELTPVEAQLIDTSIRGNDALARKQQILEQVKGPLEEYRLTIAALNALLAEGAISQENYNRRIADMANTAAQTSFAGLEGVDPATGRNYEDLSAITDENARYAKQLEDFQTYREQLLQLGVDFDALELAAAQQHQDNLAKIDRARRDVSLDAVSDMAGSMTSIMKSMFGEQSKLYKAAFAAEKAVAIARSIMAIQTGIAQAAALPFPANLPAIASVIAATASIVSNIQAVALNFKDGGYVRGRGGPRSDSVPANLSNGEFVVNARDTARNRPLLEAINAGRDARTAGAAQAAVANREVGMAAPTVNVTTEPAQVRIVNVTDPRAALAALNTAEGTQAIMNVIEQNPNSIRRVLGAN